VSAVAAAGACVAVVPGSPERGISFNVHVYLCIIVSPSSSPLLLLLLLFLLQYPAVAPQRQPRVCHCCWWFSAAW